MREDSQNLDSGEQRETSKSGNIGCVIREKVKWARGQRQLGGGGQLHGELRAAVWTLPLIPREVVSMRSEAAYNVRGSLWLLFCQV